MASIIENQPKQWLSAFPWPTVEGNKYDRGHAIVLGGPWHATGAARLAAMATLRIGAGLVSIACDTRSLPIYAAHSAAIMTKLTETPQDWSRLIADDRVASVLLGPGASVGEETRARVLEVLRLHKPAVLDADALTSFAEAPHTLFEAIRSPCIFTPHEGEFTRLFKTRIQAAASISDRALKAASMSGAVVVLKGHETVIAGPDGACVVNRNASPFLATAGSGDVLAGMITGLLAQGMPDFQAACAAVWLHGEVAKRFGAGLIAEDMATQLAPLLHEMKSQLK